MESNPRQCTCFSFFMPAKFLNKPFGFLSYKTNRLHFSVHVYCNRSQKMSQRVKNKSRLLTLSVTPSVIYYSTHTLKNLIYLLIR